MICIAGLAISASAIYQEANEFIENLLMKRILMPWIVIMTPLVIVPALFQSYFQYFNLGSGPNSFQLPFPATYVYFKRMC